MRAATSSYVVFSVLLGIPIAILIAATIRNPAAWPGVAILAALLAAILLWLRSLRIELTAEHLVYRTLFGGTCTLRRVDILRARIQIGGPGRTAPPFRLVVEARPETREGALVINLKPFARDELDRLFAELGVPE